MFKLKINEIYDVNKYTAPVIYYYAYHKPIGWDINVPVIVGSNDKKHWHKIFIPPAQISGHMSYLRISTPIPLYKYKFRYIKLVWGCHTWDGSYGDPIRFHFGKGGWTARDPQVFYAYLFDFKYTPSYALNLANYVLSHRSTYLAWGSPVNPNVTLKANQATGLGWIERWNIYTQPLGSHRSGGIYFHSTGPYGTQNLPSIIPSIYPPGTYQTPNNKPTTIKYVDLIPGWKYQKEPVHTLHSSTLTVHNFIALLHPTPFLFPIKIFTPNDNINVHKGYVTSKLNLLGKINDKDIWVSNKTHCSGKLTIDRWTFNVPPIPHVISNLRKDQHYVYFDSTYNGKARITFNNKTITYPVHEGKNKIPLNNLKSVLNIDRSGKLCIDPL